MSVARMGHWVRLVLVGVGLGGLLPVAAHSAEGVSYVYDDLGRLVGVVDPAGESALYTYDAVGNLLSITRQSSSRPVILDFTPKAGPPGTAVMLSGAGFGATAGANTVTFNGVRATVSSASARQLVVQVPVGAASGPIAVATANGSAASARPFTVAAALGKPTLTGFSPQIGTAGTGVALQGSGFESDPANNLVAFNRLRATVGAASANLLTTTVPTGATSGRISVVTPAGRAESTADFFVPPAPLKAQDVAFTGRLAINGPSLTITLGVANKAALLVFDGTAGNSAVLSLTGTTIAQTVASVFRPDGKVLTSVLKVDPVKPPGRAIPMPAFPATGTYTVLIQPINGATGAVTVSLGTVDLIPTELKIPNPVGPNQNGTYTATVLWTFKNTGTASTSLLWYDNLYLSTDPVLEASDRQLYSVLHSGSLAPGGSYTLQSTLLNLALPPGTYYLIAAADGKQLVPEANETNNVLAMPLILGPRPDLVPTRLAMQGTVLPNPDGRYTLQLSWSVRNSGASTARSLWLDGLYLSTDPLQDGGDRQIIAPLHSLNLAPGAEYTETRLILGFAANPGSYYLLLFVDKALHLSETNEENNVLSVPLLLAGRPDLTPTAFSLSTPVTRNADGTFGFGVSWTIRNGGASPTQSGWYDSFYLSTDRVWDAADREIAFLFHSASVTPGASYTAQRNITRLTAAPGSYYLILVADKARNLAEADESNNALPIPITLR